MTTEERLNALREAAEQAWGDDTRHPKYAGHPQQCQGQSRVTAEWLAQRFGGEVCARDGRFYWLTDGEVIDLAAPQGPKRYAATGRESRVVGSADARSRLFRDRANRRLDRPDAHLAKVSYDFAGDAYPGETPQAIEDRSDTYWDDEPALGEDFGGLDGPEYNWFYGNGQLHVSPVHDHQELRGHAGVSPDHNGPVGYGVVSLNGRNATWAVAGNIGASALSRILEDYTKSAGWRWAGMTDNDGEPIGTGSEYAPKKSMFYAWDGEHLYLGRDLPSLACFASNSRFGQIHISGEHASVVNIADAAQAEALQEWAFDNGFTIVAEVPGGTNMMDRMKTEDPMGESLELFDRGNIDKQLPEPEDQSNPEGHFRCPNCRNLYDSWPQYIMHLKEHEMIDDQDARAEDESKFPDRPDYDKPLPPHMWYQRGDTTLAKTIWHPDFWTRPLLRLNGWVRVSVNKWAQGQTQEPKDMIEDSIPVIYDIRHDQLHAGAPGQRTSDIPGKFSPGGIVEGEYQPGGTFVILSETNEPYSLRHLLDLWYWSFPHMKLTGIGKMDQDGKFNKLAASNIGPYIKQMVAIDPAAASAWHALTQAGGNTYVVGGAVRDAMLGKQPKDIDLMVQGLAPDLVRRALEQLPGHVDLTGKDFGVFRYRVKGHEVEIALPRSETSTGEKRKDFDVQVDHNLSVEDDLQRRDFTANSMAVNLDNGELIDPYGGANDIDQRQLRTTHPKSFEEDATRLVRALVASSRHGLMPTESLRHEIEANAYRLDGESRERIQAELDKLFASTNPAGAIRLAQETGLLKHIFPELADNFDYDQRNPHHTYSLGDHSLNVLEGVQGATDDPDLRLAGLLHDVGKPTSAWDDPDTGIRHYYLGPNGEGADHAAVGATIAERTMRDLKYPTARINRVRDLIGHHMYPDFSSMKGARKFINRVGDHADDLMTLRQYDREGKGTDDYQAQKTPVDTQRDLVEQVRQNQEPTSTAQLAVNGNDLMQQGIPQGPLIGQVLQALTEAVVANPMLNTRPALLELASQYLESQ